MTKEKAKNEICEKCRQEYERETSKVCYRAKKLKASKENFNLTNQNNLPDQIQQVTPKTYSPKTLANKKSLFRKKIVKTPYLSLAVLKELIKDLPEHLKAEFKKSFNLKSESDCMVKVVTELIRDLKIK